MLLESAVYVVRSPYSHRKLCVVATKRTGESCHPLTIFGIGPGRWCGSYHNFGRGLVRCGERLAPVDVPQNASTRAGFTTEISYVPDLRGNLLRLPRLELLSINMLG